LLAPLTGRTKTTGTALNRALAKVRQRGYAVEDQEATVGDAGIAAPILSRDGVVAGAIGVVGAARQGVMPDPRGRVRVSKLDPADKTLEFIGEDSIDHTPKNEQVLLKMGSALKFPAWSGRLKQETRALSWNWFPAVTVSGCFRWFPPILTRMP